MRVAICQENVDQQPPGELLGVSEAGARVLIDDLAYLLVIRTVVLLV